MTRRPLAVLLLLLSVFALVLRAPAGHAQSDDTPKVTLNDIIVDISRPGGQDLPLALPRPQGDAAGSSPHGSRCAPTISSITCAAD